ncbi:hypothetical protein SAMN06296241_1215 [Salinimicrobium sediminis]|uniref:Uncharacterized protein n=1 Tax=Salinimicrobium sediminis TaxID=1343891 RepID=A0A285X2W9_9FLAO|nr:hypothetical protein SAMN06296241_1215 [Salinimicrobium sediminis]
MGINKGYLVLIKNPFLKILFDRPDTQNPDQNLKH